MITSHRVNDDCVIYSAGIHFDDKWDFFGQTEVRLFAYRIKSKRNDAYEDRIEIGVFDQHNYEIGVIYHVDESNRQTILHELINWMKDHEYGCCNYDELLNPLEFFPDFNCKRRTF